MPSGSESPASLQWDVFLNYASEDRDTFVAQLRNVLAARGVRVWIDYGEITLGDALRKQIDDGLLRSRFAVVVLSPASLDKYWASAEIDALFALEQARGRKCILPVLHQLTHGELTLRRPLLAGRIAEPSHDLNRVVEAIVRVVQRTPAPAAGHARSRTYNLPPRLASFVGRSEDLAAVETALHTKRVAVSAAISGLPGIGKTALVAELAHRLAERGAFPGGIFWLPAEHPDLSLVWAREDLGGQIAPDADPKERSAETVRRLSRTSADLLVILDNVVAWGEATRPRPLPQGEHVYVLVTTRERNLGGTQLTQVPLDVLTPKDARELLLTTAGRDIEPGVDALLKHLDGHALSTELAGVYLREFIEGNASAYLAKLHAGDGVEADVPADRIRHQHTTEQALRTLWDRLDAHMRSAWCVAGAFADDPVVFALSDLCGLDEQARARLRRFHLVDIDTTQGHWDAHRLVLEFARRHPDESLRVQAERAFVRSCAQYARQFDLATGYQSYLAARPHVDRAARADLVERTLGAGEIGTFLDRVGTALQSAGHYALARQQHELALAADRKNLGDDHPNVASRRSNLGLVLKDLGDLAGAHRELELALDAGRKNLGDDHPNVAIRRSNLGLVLHDLGDLAGARRELELALDAGRKNLGDDHPQVAIRRSNLGAVLKDLGDLAGARRELELALDGGRKNLGDDHPNVARHRSNLGAVLKDLGDLAGARRELELALAADRKNLGDDHPNVASHRSNLGAVLRNLGDVAGARRELELALAADRKHLGHDHPNVAIRRSNLGAVLRNLGDLAGARRELELALDAGRKHLGDDHPQVAIRRSNLGAVLQDLGDLAGAEREGREALRVARLQPPGSFVRAGIERVWGHLDA